MSALLRGTPEVEVLTEAELARARVLVLATQTWNETQLNALRQVRGPGVRVVVVTEWFDEDSILAAAQTGVVCVLPNTQVTRGRLAAAVCAAANGAALLPRRLQGALLRQLDTLHTGLLEPSGWTLAGLGPRELDVIRLLADGYHTDEIAARLSVSEGTVKNALTAAMKRLGLTNRTHIVAYALRTGALA